MKTVRRALLLPLVCLFLPVATHPGVAQDESGRFPALVMILRHAEKPLEDKNPDLAPQGFARAKALPRLFLPGPNGAPPPFPRPDFLFAADVAKHSNRPLETIAPTAQALDEKINHDYVDIETGPVAKKIMSGKYAGKVVLICWHHGEIPHLAEAFGVPHVPKHWDPNVFDQIWEIRWVNGQAQMTVAEEHLLPGDAQ